MNRSSGILLSISSLPSPCGIGTLGKAAYEFADFLHAAGQKYWQMLPLGPTSYGDSPYQSFSSFAGNPYFIDLDMLVEDHLLNPSDLLEWDFGSDPRHVDYGKIYESRFSLLAKAKEAGWERDQEEVQQFIQENAWLSDYTLYMACKRHFQMQAWTEWKDQDLRFHKPEALKHYRTELKDDVELFTYIQFLFYQQWNALRAYLNKLGIRTIGDVPIYVPLDSADVWSEPEFFQLDENYIPKKVAGVPPDYFSEDGQLWGNPLYDWENMQADGYGWWIRRIGGAVRLFDVIRIDHFRGFSEYWAVPYGETTARNGSWVKGPGMNLVSALAGWFRENEFIAEDLGAASEGLRQLLSDSGWPGMKVLEFAFDSKEESDFLPHTYTKNCICYAGTHDNATLLEWLEDADPEDAAFARDYLGLSPYDKKTVSKKSSANDKKPSANDSDFLWAVLRAGQASVAKLFVAQIQDYLELGKGHRMNTPSTMGNWSWRLLPGELTSELADKILHLTRLYGRTDPEMLKKPAPDKKITKKSRD